MVSLGNTQDQLDNHDNQFVFQGERQKHLFLYFRITKAKENGLVLQFMLQEIKYLKEEMFLAFACRGNYYVHIEIHVS